MADDLVTLLYFGIRRLEELTRRLEALESESAEIRAEIEAIRSEVAPSGDTVDLMAVEPIVPQEAADTTPSISDVEVVNNPAATPSSRIFNPDA